MSTKQKPKKVKVEKLGTITPKTTHEWSPVHSISYTKHLLEKLKTILSSDK